MEKYKWILFAGIIFIGSSGILYLVHYSIFRDAEYILDSLLSQLAFLPVYVFLTTLIIEKLLNKREKQVLLRKLNMIIGAFFSEVGNDLVVHLSRFHTEIEEFRLHMLIHPEWTRKQFKEAKNLVLRNDDLITGNREDIFVLKEFLVQKRGFLLRLLQNPNLLEHESFTNLLWVVFHLTEELKLRKDLNRLSDADVEHLLGDIKRVYSILLIEWLEYMEHLQREYPYLLSLEIRTNPFSPEASAEVH